MKILAISDLFPPHYIGGYELACAEVMTRLAARGHDIRVLTSDYRGVGAGHDSATFPVSRSLKYSPDGDLCFPARPWGITLADCMKERFNFRTVIRAVEDFKPDVVSVWHLGGGLSTVVFQACLRLRARVVYAISDYWMVEPDPSYWYQYWRALSSAPVKRRVKVGLRAVVGQLFAPTELLVGPIEHAHFFSAYLQEEYARRGARVTDGVVIHHGIDLDLYHRRPAAAQPSGRLLYVGRLAKEKGVDVAIRAVADLRRRYGRTTVALDIAGGGEPQYLDRLQALVRELCLEEHVRFLGMLPRDEAAKLYTRYDALIFPSSWPEPFSLTLIEALACGLAVVGTTTGGSREILVDGENALVVRPNDPADFADKLELLLGDPRKREALSAAARRSVERMCDIRDVVINVEQYYEKIVADQQQNASRPSVQSR